MARTRFPARPRDVVPLHVDEFTFDLDMHDDAPSLDVVCGRFVDDVNRALVWFIRFRAMQTWTERTHAAAARRSVSGTPRDIWEVAAAFRLNDRWEFDQEAFWYAVDAAIARRSHA